MEELEKNDPVTGDNEIFDEESHKELVEDGQSEPRNATRCDFKIKMRENAPRWAIFARYLLPAAFGVLLFVFSFFDWVYFYMNGRPMKMSLFAFYKNTLTAAHTYLAGATEEQANWFYGLLAGGAIVFALVYLLALGLAVLAAVTACRAFHAGHESAESNRMKVIFKIAFPGRVLLYLSNLLFLVPVLYPEYFSAVGGRFLLMGGKETVFVETNVYTIVTAIFALLMAALALVIRNWERQKHMNMFLVWRSDDQVPDESEDDEDEE